jgi:hypothetical protein
LVEELDYFSKIAFQYSSAECSDKTLRIGFLTFMCKILQDYDKFSTMLVGEMPLFDHVAFLESKSEQQDKIFYN